MYLSSGCPCIGAIPNAAGIVGRGASPSELIAAKPASTIRVFLSGLWSITVVATLQAMSSKLHEPITACM